MIITIWCTDGFWLVLICNQVLNYVTLRVERLVALDWVESSEDSVGRFTAFSFPFFRALGAWFALSTMGSVERTLKTGWEVSGIIVRVAGTNGDNTSGGPGGPGLPCSIASAAKSAAFGLPEACGWIVIDGRVVVSVLLKSTANTSSTSLILRSLSASSIPLLSSSSGLVLILLVLPEVTPNKIPLKNSYKAAILGVPSPSIMILLYWVKYFWYGILDLAPVVANVKSAECKNIACSFRYRLRGYKYYYVWLTKTATNAIEPGVTEFTPHTMPWGFGPEYFPVPRDEGPKRIDFSIYYICKLNYKVFIIWSAYHS